MIRTWFVYVDIITKDIAVIGLPFASVAVAILSGSNVLPCVTVTSCGALIVGLANSNTLTVTVEDAAEPAFEDEVTLPEVKESDDEPLSLVTDVEIDALADEPLSLVTDAEIDASEAGVALAEIGALTDESLFGVLVAELSTELELDTALEVVFIALDELFFVGAALAEIKVLDDDPSFLVTDTKIDESALLTVSACTLVVAVPRYNAVPAITLTTPTDNLRN